MSGIIEVRGIVNKDGTISYGEFTQYDNEFGKQSFKLIKPYIDLGTHEHMLEYYHGMCRELCIKWNFRVKTQYCIVNNSLKIFATI